MKLLDKHITFIEKSLEFHGIKSEVLKEDLIDHICSYIENQESNDFEILYQEALQKFGGYSSFQNLQLETNLQKFASQTIRLKKILHGVGAICILLISAGILFKWMHWPYATILLFSGFVLLILVAIPLYFYDRYKLSIHKFS